MFTSFRSRIFSLGRSNAQEAVRPRVRSSALGDLWARIRGRNTTEQPQTNTSRPLQRTPGSGLHPTIKVISARSMNPTALNLQSALSPQQQQINPSILEGFDFGQLSLLPKAQATEMLRQAQLDKLAAEIIQSANAEAMAPACGQPYCSAYMAFKAEIVKLTVEKQLSLASETMPTQKRQHVESQVQMGTAMLMASPSERYTAAINWLETTPAGQAWRYSADGVRWLASADGWRYEAAPNLTLPADVEAQITQAIDTIVAQARPVSAPKARSINLPVPESRVQDPAQTHTRSHSLPSAKVTRKPVSPAFVSSASASATQVQTQTPRPVSPSPKLKTEVAHSPSSTSWCASVDEPEPTPAQPLYPATMRPLSAALAKQKVMQASTTRGWQVSSAGALHFVPRHNSNEPTESSIKFWPDPNVSTVKNEPNGQPQPHLDDNESAV